jgi:hypothetical protein
MPPNAARFITAIFGGCSRVVFPTNFSIASKAIASLSFASCTQNGNIRGSFEIICEGFNREPGRTREKFFWNSFAEFAARGAKKIHISLTHTENYAAATAILES